MASFYPLFLLCILFLNFLNVSGDYPIKVCANIITHNLSTFLRESNSINPELDMIDAPRNGRKMLSEYAASSPSFLEGVSLHKVRIFQNSPHGIAQRANLDYLLMLDVDKLVFGFRNVSGVTPLSASPYGGWEAPDKELRGHFVGHYLSATSMMWASTHNSNILENMNKVVDALDECQKKIGTGYLSAFPEDYLDRYEAIHIVWAPYYTIHKIMAGLLDQYNHAGNKKALRMVTWMADYFSARVDAYVRKYTTEAQFQSLNEEVGGMNDVLYNLYKITKNSTHLRTAHLFDKPCFLGLLAIQQDSLSGFHANTHIPLVVGSQSRYEVTGDNIYKDLSAFFMKSVMNSHMYVTGGTSVKEFWVDPKRLATSLDKDTEETCATYNMLKVARNLFRWTKDIQYADYYERALTNGILTVQHKHEPGVMLYMLPLAPGNSKNSSSQHWGTKHDSFWCCYGTAVESFSKLGDSIYFEGHENEKDSLYIIQFVSSSMSWDTTGLILEQNVVSPITVDNPALHLEIKLFKDKSNTAWRNTTLYVRIPSWASPSCIAEFNNIQQDITPGTFLVIERLFKHGDKLSLKFPATLRLEHIQDDRPQYSQVNAVSFGPFLLAGLTTAEWETGPVDITTPSEWIFPVLKEQNNHLYTFTQETTSLSLNTSTWTLGQSNGTIILDDQDASGMDWRFQSTFKVLFSQQASMKIGLIGNTISMELMYQPGMFLSHNGVNQKVGVVAANSSFAGISTRPSTTYFKVHPAMSSQSYDAVSFEAEDFPGCFLSSTGPRSPLVLKCKPVVPSDIFNTGASFIVNQGVARYHPISFIASAPTRSYLLFPMNDYTNEHYTVYFNMK